MNILQDIEVMIMRSIVESHISEQIEYICVSVEF